MEPIILKLKTLASSYYIGIVGVYMKQMFFDKALDALKSIKNLMEKVYPSIERAYHGIAFLFLFEMNYQKELPINR